MLDKMDQSLRRKPGYNENRVIALCRELESGGVSLPDDCPAFQSKK